MFEEKIYRCLICGESFRTQRELNAHEKVFHDVENDLEPGTPVSPPRLVDEDNTSEKCGKRRKKDA
jgi:hypothetical protein